MGVVTGSRVVADRVAVVSGCGRWITCCGGLCDSGEWMW